MTHCRLSCENPRSVLIEGSATLTMATSRMTMNCAMTMSARAHQRLSVRFGVSADRIKTSAFSIIDRHDDSTRRHLVALHFRRMTVTPTQLPPGSGPSRELMSSTPFLLKRLGWAIKDKAFEAFASTGLTPQHHAVLSLLDEGVRETQ